jgi:hypothetical protein
MGVGECRWRPPGSLRRCCGAKRRSAACRLPPSRGQPLIPALWGVALPPALQARLLANDVEARNLIQIAQQRKLPPRRCQMPLSSQLQVLGHAEVMFRSELVLPRTVEFLNPSRNKIGSLVRSSHHASMTASCGRGSSRSVSAVGTLPIRRFAVLLEDSLLAVQSSAATNGPNTDRMGQSDRSRRTDEDIR